MRKSGIAKYVSGCLSPLDLTASIVNRAQKSRKQIKHVSEKPEVGRMCHAFEKKSACAATTFSPLSVDGI